MRQENLFRVAAAGLGALLLTGVAGAALADDAGYGEEGVDLLVEVEAAVEPGALALSVAGDEAVFAEDAANTDPLIRVFAATLPDVTVSDTRDPAGIDAAAQWYVVGSATDFEDQAGVAADIPVGRLGWTPALAASVDTDEVSEGDAVLTTYDTGPNAVGLGGSELFAMAANSAEINPTGSWTANAALVLKADATVAPANYKSVLTLSLFE
ncbi:MAG: hypothetical protein LBD51_08075 [Bifidobacteriaceae bacterium]|jgi:hypothetical protein|nr:hypothetical protein [Bifidobacteriaceae bacterium]